MTQEQLPPNDEAAPEPVMELLDGDATASPTTGPSLLTKIARGSMYGVLLLAATALLAVSAVPELAEYASFIPEPASRSSAPSGSCSSSCTTLDQVSFDSPCCAAKAAKTAMASAESGSCCPLSDESAANADEALVAASADVPACCRTKGAVATEETPIDAGSLLVAATTEEPTDEQPAEDGTELKPDQDEVEE